MSIEDLLNQIENILEEGKRSIVGDKVKVDAEEIRQIVTDIRVSMPDEIIQARKIANERKMIFDSANEQADLIVKKAETKAANLVEEHEITRRAEEKGNMIVADAKKEAEGIIADAKDNSNEIVANAQQWANDLKTGATNYVDKIMNACKEILTQGVDECKEHVDALTKQLNTVNVVAQRVKDQTSKKSDNNAE